MKTKRILALLLAVVMLAGTVFSVRAENEAPTVESVTEMLEELDTLQQIQNNRDKYTTAGHYDITTTDQARINRHLSTRASYETYVSTELAAREAAKEAFNALSTEEQAQIDPALAAKLEETLETELLIREYSVTPADDAYIYETIGAENYLAYEVSHYMVAGQIPQTFVLHDTSDGQTTFTPDGLFVNGESNYEVAYCADISQGLEWGTDYMRVNLEDSGYYSEYCAEHIRAIVSNSYPFVTMDEMKESLKAGGLNSDFVDSLNRSDIIAAVQLSIWKYSNPELFDENNSGYFTSISTKKNTGIYFTPMHDFTNETWEWLPSTRQRSFDARAAYRVNNLAYYLCNLEGVKADEDSIIISDIKVGRADIENVSENLYKVGLHVILNSGASGADDVSLRVVSYSKDENGNVTRTSSKSIKIGEAKEYGITINAKYGDSIEVTVEGTQHVEKNVYLYMSRGGKTFSQTLVSVSEGITPVLASETFTFERDIDAGLRIYKKSSEDKTPISDITFHVYSVENENGRVFDEAPTAEEIAKYAVAENLVGSVVTDSTGYAAIELPNEGTYLVVEEHNKEKVEKPVDPFYITLPCPVEVEVETENGVEKVIEYHDIVSVHPKNTPIVPPPPPPPPPPLNIVGSFEIIKHASNNSDRLLEGAEFTVYRAAKDGDTDTESVKFDGKTISVVPVKDENGSIITLTTDENGAARSPELDLGLYYLKETKAPAGYLLPGEVFSVYVTSKEIQEVTYLYVPNESIFRLPETGGMGTVIFVGLGGTMFLVAGIFLATNKIAKAKRKSR